MKRGGPLKRTGGLSRGSGLKRTGGLSGGGALKRTPIKRRSNERQKFMTEERIPTIKAMVDAGRTCEVGPLLLSAGVPGAPRCTKGIQGLHERRKRSSGGSLRNPANLIPACNRCNGWLEDEPDPVRKFTGTLLVLREGDEEWESLGRRNDLHLGDEEAT